MKLLKSDVKFRNIFYILGSGSVIVNVEFMQQSKEVVKTTENIYDFINSFLLFLIIIFSIYIYIYIYVYIYIYIYINKIYIPRLQTCNITRVLND